jgi:hypothetical protein
VYHAFDPITKVIFSFTSPHPLFLSSLGIKKLEEELEK